jgi:starvation-inducible outer membrane lipoprotein
MKNILLPIIALLFLVSCFQDPQKQAEENNNKDNVTEVLVQEAIEAGAYTYLKVSGNKGEQWLAVPKMKAKPGDIFYYSEQGLPMRDFKSKELDKTFELVWFLNRVYDNPDDIKKATMPKSHSQGSNLVVKKEELNVEQVEGGITIAELLSNKKKYEGQKVKIRGKVVKFNANIMKTNWIHIQDGTEHDGKYDLVVTSNAKFKVGDVVTISGKVTLDKDFGHGYFYEVIIEDANTEIAEAL